MLNFVLCDDNKNILMKLEKMIEIILIKNKLDGEIGCSVNNPADLMQYIQNNTFDVAILDIDLKSEISGINLANDIRKINKKAYIIFTTAHLEYLLIAYKYKTFDFLPKPVTLERLEETILRLFDDISSGTSVFFHLNNKKILVKSDDILFIEKQGKKAIFKTVCNTFEYNSSFNDILNDLPDNFIRCHKSYIVNLNKISYIESNNTIFFNENHDLKCYIGPKYENYFAEVINYEFNSKLMECFDYRRRKFN